MELGDPTVEETPPVSPACTPPPTPREYEEEPDATSDEEDADSICTDTETEPGNAVDVGHEVVDLVTLPVPPEDHPSAAFDQPRLPPVAAGAYGVTTDWVAVLDNRRRPPGYSV